MPTKRSAEKGATKPTQSRIRSANWTDALDVILLQVLKEQHLLGNCIGGQIKKDAWKDIILAFNQQSGMSLEKDHLKNRIKVLRTTFAFYSTLASRSGWSWDYVLNKPKPESSSDWETAIAENPKYAKCKDRPFKAYKDLEVLYGKSLIVGKHDPANTQDDDDSGDDTSLACLGDINAPHVAELNLNNGEPSSSKVLRSIRAANLTSLHFPSVLHTQPTPISSNPIPSNPQSPLNECPTEDREIPPRKRGRYSSSAPCACKMLSTCDTKVLSELVEIGRQCLGIARELLNHDLVAKPKVYSIEECIEKLKGLQGLSQEAILAAIEAFKDKDNRSIFINLNGSVLSAWIDRQVVMQSGSPTVVDK